MAAHRPGSSNYSINQITLSKRNQTSKPNISDKVKVSNKGKSKRTIMKLLPLAILVPDNSLLYN